MVFEILIAILAACGVLLLIWCAMGLFLRPIGGRQLLLLYPVRGDAAELEQAARGAAWLQETGLVSAGLTVVDCGLSEEGRQRLRALSARITHLHCIPEAELPTILKTER